MIVVLFFLAIVFLVVLMFISIYNRLIRLRNNSEQAFADIDVQLRQRHDLIPQLVDSVKGYMGHERGVLTDLQLILLLKRGSGYSNNSDLLLRFSEIK